jgi:hypothetical protein
MNSSRLRSTAKTTGSAPVKINPALIGAKLVGALGGFLFGFDKAVISGCQSDLVKLFSLTSGQQGFMTASAMLGGHRRLAAYGSNYFLGSMGLGASVWRWRKWNSALKTEPRQCPK